MQSIGAYLLSVSGAAILCGLADRFLGKSGASSVAKLLTGLFLTLTILSPLKNLSTDSLRDFSVDISISAQDAVARGKETTQKAMADIIKEQTQAYILHRASALQADVSVTVEVSDDTIPVPIGVRIIGSITPSAQARLAAMLEQELGISKENQQWT